MAQVLIVDDSATVRADVADFLSENGLQVAAAADGREGLARLAADPAIKLILCDVNMPNMDGLTMAEKVRETDRDVVIIMLTTENDSQMKERGKAAGVKGWIVKPFNGPSVLGAVRRLVGG